MRLRFGSGLWMESLQTWGHRAIPDRNKPIDRSLLHTSLSLLDWIDFCICICLTEVDQSLFKNLKDHKYIDLVVTFVQLDLATESFLKHLLCKDAAQSAQ